MFFVLLDIVSESKMNYFILYLVIKYVFQIHLIKILPISDVSLLNMQYEIVHFSFANAKRFLRTFIPYVTGLSMLQRQ